MRTWLPAAGDAAEFSCAAAARRQLPGVRQAIAMEAEGGPAGDVVVLHLLDPAQVLPPHRARTGADPRSA